MCVNTLHYQLTMDSTSTSSSSSPPLVLSIPQHVPLNHVGLNKAVRELHHAGFQCEIDHATRQVSFNGSETQLKDTIEHFERLFGQLVVASPAPALPARIRQGTRVNPQQRNRSFAALGADSTSYWRFVPTRSNVSDVNIRKFPYELERVPGNPRLPALASARMDDYKPPRRRLGDARGECRFLMTFDDLYLAREAETLNNAVIVDQQREALKLKAVFGRKLFDLNTVKPNTMYHVDILRGYSRNFRHCRSSWSNICDSDGPELQRLVSKLHEAKAKLDIAACKEEIAIWLKLMDDQFKITFARGGDTKKWAYKSTKRSPGSHFAHDISLADRVNFRVRVYNKLTHLSAEDPIVEELRAMVVVHEPEAGDNDGIVSSTVKTVENAPASVEWRMSKRVVKVPYEGLVFKMLQLSDELQLEAHLPLETSGEMPTTSAALGDNFKYLVEKLHAIVMNDSDLKAVDADDSSGRCP